MPPAEYTFTAIFKGSDFVKTTKKKFVRNFAALCLSSTIIAQGVFIPAANAMSLWPLFHLAGTIQAFISTIDENKVQEEETVNHDASRWVPLGANHQPEAEDDPDDMFITIKPGVDYRDYTYDYHFNGEQ